MSYGNIEPEIDWGYCPKCDATNLEWFEEGPICPTCGHLWDQDGMDLGTWEESMGTDWRTSRTRQQFIKREETQREWLRSLTGRFMTRDVA